MMTPWFGLMACPPVLVMASARSPRASERIVGVPRMGTAVALFVTLRDLQVSGRTRRHLATHC